MYNDIDKKDLELIIQSALALGFTISDNDINETIIEKAIDFLSNLDIPKTADKTSYNNIVAEHLHYSHVFINSSGHCFNKLLKELYNKTNFLYWGLNLFNESVLICKYITRDKKYCWGILDKDDLPLNLDLLSIKATYCNKNIMHLIKNRKYNEPDHFDIIFYAGQYRKPKNK